MCCTYLNFHRCFAYKTSVSYYYPKITYQIFLYLTYRLEPETNTTNYFALLGFHIYEEKVQAKLEKKQNKNAIKDRAV